MPQDGPRNTLPVKVRGHREPRVSADNFLGELMKDVRRVSPVAVDVIAGSSRFVVNDPAGAGIHATVFAALVSRIRIR